jgi:acyl-CoA thioesterase II
MSELTIELPAFLQLERLDGHRFLLPKSTEVDLVRGSARDVVGGSNLLARMMIASHQTGDGKKDVKSAHAIFARPARHGSDIEIDVDSVHAGRAFASDNIRARQNDVTVSSAIIMWSLDEPDLIRHAMPMPDVVGPDSLSPDEARPGAADMRIVDGVDTWTADAPTGPPQLFVWVRYPETDTEQVVHQALLCSITGGLLIPTAMRPHPGINQDSAHRQISTGVVNHTINFHDRFDISNWLLLALESPWAGRGRTHGRGLVFTEDGRLVATCSQDNMVRHFTDHGDHSSEYRTIM